MEGQRVKASRVTEDNVFYKCPYCSKEHIHGIWYEGGMKPRTSHCTVNKTSVSIVVTPKTKGYKEAIKIKDHRKEMRLEERQALIDAGIIKDYDYQTDEYGTDEDDTGGD